MLLDSDSSDRLGAAALSLGVGFNFPAYNGGPPYQSYQSSYGWPGRATEPAPRGLAEAPQEGTGWAEAEASFRPEGLAGTAVASATAALGDGGGSAGVPGVPLNSAEEDRDLQEALANSHASYLEDSRRRREQEERQRQQERALLAASTQGVAHDSFLERLERQREEEALFNSHASYLDDLKRRHDPFEEQLTHLGGMRLQQEREESLRDHGQGEREQRRRVAAEGGTSSSCPSPFLLETSERQRGLEEWQREQERCSRVAEAEARAAASAAAALSEVLAPELPLPLPPLPPPLDPPLGNGLHHRDQPHCAASQKPQRPTPALARTFGPRQYLTDESIRFAYTQLEDELTGKEVLFMEPAVCHLLLHRDSEEVKQVKEELKLHERKVVLCPINDSRDPSQADSGMHWTLLVCWDWQPDYAGSDTGSFAGLCFYNSLSTSTFSFSFRQAQKLASVLTGKDVVPRAGHCAQQANGYDCGIYVILFSEIVAKSCVEAATAAADGEPWNAWEERLAAVTPRRAASRRTDYFSAFSSAAAGAEAEAPVRGALREEEGGAGERREPPQPPGEEVKARDRRTELALASGDNQQQALAEADRSWEILTLQRIREEELQVLANPPACGCTASPVDPQDPFTWQATLQTQQGWLASLSIWLPFEYPKKPPTVKMLGNEHLNWACDLEILRDGQWSPEHTISSVMLRIRANLNRGSPTSLSRHIGK
jgi:sentrin-specific protease 8